MSFLEKMEENASKTRTLNGAAAYDSTGDACLDFFAVAGGMRYRSRRAQIMLFDKAYIENPELAMKLLFHIRDIRCGMGERQLFRTLLRYVADNWPDSASKNVSLIAEYGRWDDLMCLLGTEAEKEVAGVIRKQLSEDLAALERRNKGEPDAHISLLAKWLPSINASSRATQRNGRIMAKLLKMSPTCYRKALSLLRSNICLTEKYLTQKNTEKIRFEAVPAGAMLKYRNSLPMKEPEKFRQFVSDVKAGEAKVHAESLFPYELIRPCFKDVDLFEDICNSKTYSKAGSVEDEVIEMLWEAMPEIASSNGICVVDTSGSMFCSYNGFLPALFAVSLGLYYAEKCKGPFRNKFITFESNPHLMDVHGSNLKEKIRYILSTAWGGSTNIEGVFDLILRSALESNCSREELPSTIHIISDMEFDTAVADAGKTIYENAKQRFEMYGYELPAVAFINVNSWQMQTPVRKDTKGTALASGMSTAVFNHKFDGNITPMKHMLRVLLGDRYKEVHA